MTITELQILLDLNYDNETIVLNKHASLTEYGSWLFIDSENGYCYFFNKNGKIDDIKKMKMLYSGNVKKDIEKIVIPESVESIGPWAFYSCKSLKSIEIPENVKNIEEAVFYNCTSLISIEIPKSVESIGFNAFYNCTSLKEVIFKDKTIDQVKAMDNYPWELKMSLSSNAVNKSRDFLV